MSKQERVLKSETLSLFSISFPVPCIRDGELFFCFHFGTLFFNNSLVFSPLLRTSFFLATSCRLIFLLREAFPIWKRFRHPLRMAQLKLSSRPVRSSLGPDITTNNLRRFLDLVTCFHTIREISLCQDQLTKSMVSWWALGFREWQQRPSNWLISFCFLASVS